MGADKKKSKKKKEGGGGFGIAKMFGLDGKKKKKFKKERDDKKKGPMHSISPFQKNGTKLIANAEFYDFSPMPCVCLSCCNSELVQEALREAREMSKMPYGMDDGTVDLEAWLEDDYRKYGQSAADAAEPLIRSRSPPRRPQEAPASPDQAAGSRSPPRRQRHTSRLPPPRS